MAGEIARRASRVSDHLSERPRDRSAFTFGGSLVNHILLPVRLPASPPPDTGKQSATIHISRSLVRATMSTIAQLGIPAEEFALRETLSRVPDVTVEAERVVAHDDGRVMPF